MGESSVRLCVKGSCITVQVLIMVIALETLEIEAILRSC